MDCGLWTMDYGPGTDFHILIWGVEKYLGGGCFFIKIDTVAFKYYI